VCRVRAGQLEVFLIEPELTKPGAQDLDALSSVGHSTLQLFMITHVRELP
jgi:hypothetical protein